MGADGKEDRQTETDIRHIDEIEGQFGSTAGFHEAGLANFPRSQNPPENVTLRTPELRMTLL